MSGRNQGNAVATNRALKLNLKRKSTANFPYYTVIVGYKPGVYNKWADFLKAIGGGLTDSTQFEWKGFYSHDKAKEYLKEMKKRVRRIERAISPHLLPNHDGRPASIEEALVAVQRELGAHPALPSGADAFINVFKLNRDDEGRFVVYTHGAFFKAGPDYADSKAAAGIWFGEQSKLNCSLPCFSILRRSKNDVEILAVLFALKVANLAEMPSVCIKSRSKFVCTRVTSNNFDGASHVLLENLRMELAQIPQVICVLSKVSEHGAKEAETLANSEASRG